MAPTHEHDPGAQLGDGRDAGARSRTCWSFGEDVGYFGGVFRVTEGLQKKHGLNALLRHADRRGRHRRRRHRHGRLRPAARSSRSSSPTTSIPAYDQLVSEAARLRYRSAGEFTAPITVRTPYGGGIFGGQTHSQSPEALFTHVAGLKTVIPSNALRRQGPADRRHRGRRSGDLPGAQAALQRPVRRPPRSAGARLAQATRRARCRTATTRCRSARRAVVREGADVTVLAYGTMVHVALAAAEEAGVDAEVIDLRTLAAARHRHDRRLGEEDRPLRHRARGDAHLRLRRRAVRAGAGALLLSPGGADRAGDRLGHALSARLRMGLFPGPEARRPRRMRSAMEG